MAIPRKLTKKQCHDAAPNDGRMRRLYDSNGLYLQVMPTGAKYWRMKFTYQGKEKTLALGVFPEVAPEQAREVVLEQRKLLRAGQDPVLTRRMEKLRAKVSAENSFEVVARKWHESRREIWTSNKHSENILGRLVKDAFATLGPRPISEIKPMEVMSVIQAVQDRGARDVARRLLQYIVAVFDFGINNCLPLHCP